MTGKDASGHARPRIVLGRGLIALSQVVESLTIAVMRPDDLIEFSRQTYAQPAYVAALCADDNAGAGLYDEEQALLAALGQTDGRLLLLGTGGGREAVPLARLGFAVTVVDFVPALVEQTLSRAAGAGLAVSGLVQEISQLDVPAGTFDVVWLSAAMYSSVPSRPRRIAMLRRIWSALVPGGRFLCQYFWRPGAGDARRTHLAQKLVAYATLGNRNCEPGDMLLHNLEFIHAFSTEQALRSEFADGGFQVVELCLPEQKPRGGAILRKPPHS